jgi:hypothetical protein
MGRPGLPDSIGYANKPGKAEALGDADAGAIITSLARLPSPSEHDHRARPPSTTTEHDHRARPPSTTTEHDLKLTDIVDRWGL